MEDSIEWIRIPIGAEWSHREGMMNDIRSALRTGKRVLLANSKTQTITTHVKYHAEREFDRWTHYAIITLPQEGTL